MKFSIIIPAKNEEKYLPGCLDSIRGLDYQTDQIEIIVVDNGSSDGTRDIAVSYHTRVLRGDGMNISGLRNFGAREAKGDILAFVDADCVVSPDWLKNAAVYLDTQGVAAWGAPPKLPETSTWVQRTWYLVRQKQSTVQDVQWLETMNLFARKDQFLEIGGFNESLITCEDVDLSYRIRKFGMIVSDSRIEVIHLGEARTLSEFVKKEIWRGQSNLHGIRSHGLIGKELPSLSIPLYFGVFLPIMLVMALVFRNQLWLLMCLLFFLLPSIAVVFKVRGKEIGPTALFRLLFLIHVYFFARTVAVVKR